MNEFTENEFLPNVEILRKFEETTHTQKDARKRIDIELKGFLCLRTGAAHKSRNVWFCSGGFSFAIRAISVFRVKFNVEFTRQAVNFSIKFPTIFHTTFI